MYNNNPYAQPYGQAVQQQQPAAWQQQQQQPGAAPPPPAGTAPPPPPSMPAGLSAEQAAQYSNYGYGSVPQRGGAGRGAGQNNAFRQGQQAAQPMAPHGFNPGQPPAGAPFSPAHPGQAQPMHAGASHQGAGHPHKRPRFDSGNHANAGLPQNPQYQQMQQPQVAPMQQQQPQQMQYAYPQQQPPLPPGPPPQMQPGQPYYQQPVQQAYPMQQQQQQPMQQVYSPQPGVPQPVYYAQPGQPMMQMQPMQQGVQAYPPAQGFQQPMQMQQNMHVQPQAGPPPLAVAPMKPGGPKGGPARKGRNQHALPTAPHLHPPPPPSEPPPPPSGPSGINRNGSIKLSPKGAATLPPTPTGPANPPTSGQRSGNFPSIPTGPASAVSIKRDTRPLPSQSSTAAAARQDRHQQHQPDQRVPTGPSGRGGRGGAFAPRGGRGGPPARGGFGDRRALGRSNGPSDARSNASTSSNAGNKRTFSQTSAGGSAVNQKSARPRADSNVTITSQTIPGPSTKSFKNRSAKFGGPAAAAAPLSNSVRASSVFSTASGKGGSQQKKTLTDFRLESLEIPELGWSWKATPLSVIMERMVLKDKEKEVARQATVDEPDEVDDQAKDVKQEDEEHPLEGEANAGTVEAGKESLTTEIAGQEATQDTVDSSAMQKSDSRREKRKHSGDDEETDGQDQGKTDDTEIPLGKKVKSEVAVEPHADDALPHESAGIDQPADIEANVEPSTSGDDKGSADEASSEPALAVAQTDSTAEGATLSDTPLVEVTKKSPSVELAASSKPHIADTGAEDGNASQDPAAVDAEEKKTVPEESSSTRAAEQLEAEPSDQRRYRENSRLRIYFATPSEVLPSPAKKEKPSRGQKRRAKLELDAAHSERAMSVETTFTDATAQPENRDGEPEEQTGEPETADEDHAEDLDGEPLREEAAPSATNGQNAPDGTEVPGAEAAEAEQAILDATASSAEASKESKEEADVGPAQGIAQVEAVGYEDSKTEGSMAPAENTGPATLENLPEPSEDRVSISYGRNTRRLVLDAEIIKEVRISRADGRVELKVKLSRADLGTKEDQVRVCKGFAIETLASEDGDFEEVDRDALSQAWPAVDDDATDGEEGPSVADELLPPLHRLLQPATKVEQAQKAEGESESAEDKEAKAGQEPFTSGTLTIVAHLDKKFPLTEAKWVRSGKPDEWIESISGPAAISGNATPKGQPAVTRSAWIGKIKVIDPEAPPPPPTFGLVLENWLSAANARLGFDEARYRFISTHFKDINNMFEVLLRLIRGVNAYHYAANASPAFMVAVEAAAPAHPEQQTPISLATFQLFKLGIDAAKEAGMPQEAVEKKVGEVIRMLPFFQICKSLDAIFADYKKASAQKDGKQASSQQQQQQQSQRQPPRRPFQQNQKRQRKNA